MPELVSRRHQKRYKAGHVDHWRQILLARYVHLEAVKEGLSGGAVRVLQKVQVFAVEVTSDF